MDAAPGTAVPPIGDGGSASKPPRPSPFAAFAYRDFRFYTAARFLATTAVQMQSVAVGFQVYALTHRPLDLGYVGLAQFLPIACLSIVGGQVADRFDRRVVLFVANLAFAASALALYLLSRSPAPSLAAIFAVLVFFGAARAFYGPAGSSLLPSLVPREHFPNAVTWQSTFWEAAAISGPSLGGLIYGFAGGPGPVYLGTTVALGGACLCLTAIRPLVIAVDRGPATLATALAGLHYVFRHKILLGSISLDFFAVFLGGATALLPVYATTILDCGPQGLGLLRAAPAAGAGVMAAFLAFRPLGGRAGPKMLVGVACFGAATVAFGLSRSFAISLAALFVLGASDMVSMVVRGTLVQQATPSAMRGRVSAVNLIFIGASNELGELESGTVAQWLGPVPSVVLGGAGTLLVVLAAATLFPEIRRVDRLEDVTPPADA